MEANAEHWRPLKRAHSFAEEETRGFRLVLIAVLTLS
jgi:hypothetical protein